MPSNQSTLKKSIADLHHEAYMEISLLSAEHPHKPDLVKQLDKSLSKIFEAIRLIADEIDKIKAER